MQLLVNARYERGKVFRVLVKLLDELFKNLGADFEKIGYTPIFDSKRAEMPLFLGIIRSFDLAKM